MDARNGENIGLVAALKPTMVKKNDLIDEKKKTLNTGH